MTDFEDLDTFHECLTLEELQQKRAEFATARQNNAARKALYNKRDSCKANKFNSSKKTTKPALDKPWWACILDFATK